MRHNTLTEKEIRLLVDRRRVKKKDNLNVYVIVHNSRHHMFNNNAQAKQGLFPKYRHKT